VHGLRLGLALLIASIAYVSKSDAASERHFGLRVTVPIACSIDRLEANAPGLLMFEEFCNATAGYRLFVRHDPAAADDALHFRYDGRWLPADPSGVTLLADEPQAGRYRRSLEVRPARSATAGITLLIVPR
jgi:hypothetical protein